MSSAFIRESDEQSLSDLPPTMNALINYLTRENNGIRVYEIRRINTPSGEEVHVMSNGLGYFKNETGRWQIAEKY